MKNLIIILLHVLVLSMLVFSGCDNSVENTKESVKEVKIGAILPLTGKYSDLGNWVRVGLELAIMEINREDTSYRFNLLIEDAKSEPKEALSAYNKLINVDDVEILITTSSSISLAIKSKALEDSVLLFSIASHPEVTTGNNGLIFRPCNTSVEETNTITNFVQTKITGDKKNIWIVYHNSEFGISFRDELQSNLGGAIAGATPFGDDPASLRSIALKVVSNKPEIIITIGFTPSLGLLIKQFDELNYDGIICSNIGFTTPSVVEAAGKGAEGVYYVDYKLPRNQEHFIKLDSISQEKFNTNFASMSYLAYFTAKSLNEVITKQGSIDIDSIASYLRTPRVMTIEGITLNTQSNGNILPELYMNRYEN